MASFADSKTAAQKMVAGLGGDAEANKKTVGDLTKLMKKEGPALLAELIPSINGLSEEACPAAVKAMLGAVGAPGYPHLVETLPALFALTGHKKAPVREAAEGVAKELMTALPGDSLRVMKKAIFDATDRERAWQTRVFALTMLGSFASTAPKCVRPARRMRFNSDPETVSPAPQFPLAARSRASSTSSCRSSRSPSATRRSRSSRRRSRA